MYNDNNHPWPKIVILTWVSSSIFFMYYNPLDLNWSFFATGDRLQYGPYWISWTEFFSSRFRMTLSFHFIIFPHVLLVNHSRISSREFLQFFSSTSSPFDTFLRQSLRVGEETRAFKPELQTVQNYLGFSQRLYIPEHVCRGGPQTIYFFFPPDVFTRRVRLTPELVRNIGVRISRFEYNIEGRPWHSTYTYTAESIEPHPSGHRWKNPIGTFLRGAGSFFHLLHLMK